MFSFNNLSNACTNLIVTKGASTDGSVMVTYSADSYNLYGELYQFKAAVYPNGSNLDIYEWDTGKFLGTIPQAGVTYNVIGNMNEHQVAIGETTFGGREELTNEKGIMDYGSLIYVALQRSKSAREAIDIMTNLVEEYGYYSSGESFSIADKNEAWIMELIGKGKDQKGAVWVARKIPDGYVCGHANQARITTFPLNDPENCIYSKDVISFAKEMGYYSGTDEDFDFAAAYNPLDFGGIRFCDGRVWSMFNRVNKEMYKYIDYINGASLDRMPPWIKPDKKLAVNDVMKLMRDHFEGTDLDMTKGIAAAPFESPYRCSPLTFEVDGEKYFHERPISTYQTAFSFVSQSRNYLPNEIGGILWFGFDDTYMTVYTPLYSSITEIPYNYKTGLASLGKFNWDSAFWTFNAVSNFVYPRYSLVINDLKMKQDELEGGYLAEHEIVDKTALSLLNKSKGEAVKYLTEYSVNAGNNTYNTWKEFFGFLNMKYMDGVVKNEFAKPKRIGYQKEFLKKIVEDKGDQIKMRKVQPQIEMEFSNNVKMGNQFLADKDYTGAKKHFEEALKIKSDNEELKLKLDKINEMLKSIDELHNNSF